ncbi:helix-turn-helix domain-containing protein [Paenibacillus guangzhouensis]|uniref:helix-turn-helix domain-containing protein n=1 Tax=Paenibacillus guangzhouensis TaxID=1473112 RepID=UPI001266AC17|nr:helix-turn-helix domain-containing protein [Paenibacillus guangzhouensis]
MEMRTETEWIELWQVSDDFQNVAHQHDEWIQVTLPIKGTCHFTQEARNYDLRQGNGMIQPPGAKHNFHLGEQTSVIILKVRDSGVSNAASIHPRFTAGADYSIRQAFDPDDIIRRFSQWMLALIQGQTLADPLAKQEVEHDVMTYLAALLRHDGEMSGTAELLRGCTDPHILRALTFMHDCYENTISIDELAGIALQSRFHFIRSFRKATGTTPYQYLLKLRIAEAMLRLRRSGATIGQISADLGFSSTSQFHRAFLKMTGLTPQVYRLQ